MKANELRIGNMCHKRNGVDCVTIDVIDISQLVKWEETNYSEIPPLLPIPLTEEWLLRMGFEDNHQQLELWIGEWHFKYGVNNDGSKYFDLAANGYYAYQGELDMLNTCKHVHQLQNLYFALTGEELTIKNQ